MTTYNTGNPIGSTDARDRLDNSENMDILENSTTLNEHQDRLGTMRKTRKGMELEHDNQIAAHEVEHDNQMQSFESDFDGRLAGMAFTRIGTFTTGATLTDMRQTLLWEVSQGGDGREYGWVGSFLPSGKVVAAGSSPTPVSAGNWVDRTDLTLRSELLSNTGISIVGGRAKRSVYDFLLEGQSLDTPINLLMRQVMSGAMEGDRVEFPAHGYSADEPVIIGYHNGKMKPVFIEFSGGSWANGTNNGAYIVASSIFSGDVVLDVYGNYQGSVGGVLIDTVGLAHGVRFRSINPIRTVMHSCSDVLVWDSTYSHTKTAFIIGDDSANQVSEMSFHRLRSHNSMLHAVDSRGDNLQNTSFNNCTLDSYSTSVMSEGGGSLCFISSTGTVETSNPFLSITAVGGGNNTSINVVPARISFINCYWEPNATTNIVSFRTTGLALPSDSANDYPGRTEIEFIGCGCWCSTARTIVNSTPTIPCDVLIVGGRWHNITKFLGGAISSVQTTNTVTLLSPSITGANANTILTQSYGQPYSFSRGVMRALQIVLASNSSGLAEFIQADNGSFLFKLQNQSALFTLTPTYCGFYGATYLTPIKMGSRYEWYDTSGNKRSKVGIPASALDGVIISANPVN